MANQMFDALIWNNIFQKQCLPYQIISCAGKNVSEALTPEIEKWKYCPILINAPTGSGKSTFVFHALADHAAELGCYVLVLSNRLALNVQQKASLQELYHLPCVGSKALADNHSFRNVILLTYQRIIHELNLGYITSLPVKYVVFDEAHFFCSDSTFNPWTGSILTALQNTFPNAVRIYMSATPETVKPMIAAFEKLHLDRKTQPTPQGAQANSDYNLFAHMDKLAHKPAILEYKFQADFQNVALSFFYKWESILEMIQSSSDSPEKWLIFVSDKNVGKNLKTELRRDYADYIDADSAPSYIAKLSRRQYFTQKVLISTSVIDNGLSILDRNLTHIVIDTLDRVELIQMLGRKRLAQDEKIQLYVKLPEPERISSYRQAAEMLYATITSYEKNPAHFIYANWGALTPAQQNVFAPHVQNNGLFLGPNIFAKYQLATRCYELEQLEDQIEQDELAFAKQVCGWLQKEFSPDMVIGDSVLSTAIEKMTAILNANVNAPISAKEDIQALADELKACLSQRELKKLSFKNDGSNRGAADIRKLLKKYNLPFTLSNKEKNFYHIYAKETT